MTLERSMKGMKKQNKVVVAGAGTMQPIKKSQAAVNMYANKAGHKTSDGTEHVKELDKLVD